MEKRAQRCRSARDVNHVLDNTGNVTFAVKLLGDETLRTIARDLVATVRANMKIDWTVREDVRLEQRMEKIEHLSARSDAR